jgi:hypothetical protein
MSGAKPILKVVIQDKPAEATVNALFEDLYNKVGGLKDSLTGVGKLDRPHISASSVGYENIYAYAYLYCLPVKDALIYVWRFRIRGTTRWSTWFSVENETKILTLAFATEYEFGVLALNATAKSDWSYTILLTMVDAPKPSIVTGIAITDEALYIDPTTGITLASVKVEWDNNADSELVDSYEVIWY